MLKNPVIVDVQERAQGTAIRGVTGVSVRSDIQRRLKMKKRMFRKITGKCAVLYRWFSIYRRRVRMAEFELGGQLEAC